MPNAAVYPSASAPKDAAVTYAILFDIDGTLLNADSAGRLAMEETLRLDFGVERPSADVPMHGRTDSAIIADVLAKAGLDVDPAAFQEAYVPRLRAMLSRRDSRLLPGAAEAVAEADAREDLLAGLLTGNLPGAADAKLRPHGLADCFPFGAFGHEHTERDDVARGAAARLAEQGGPRPENVWVVGDTTADIACARAAGFQAAAVCTGGGSRDELIASEPDLLLDSLVDRAALFDRLT